MDATLICFSQTGNTARVARAMLDALGEAGCLGRLLPLKEAAPEDATRGYLLGVGTPCLSSRAPTPVKEFLRSLPPLGGRPAFVFATSGGAPGRALYDLTRLLRARGADVRGGFLCPGEVHHPAPHLTGQFPGRPNLRDLDHARRFTLARVTHLSAGHSAPPPVGKPGALQHGWGFYDFIGSVSSDRLLRALLPAPRLDPFKCDRCCWCADECPMSNISLGCSSSEPSHPTLGNRCIRCYRCLTGCPQGAFGADWRFADPFLLLLYNQRFMRWFGALKPDQQLT